MTLPFTRTLHRTGRRSLIWLLVVACLVYAHSASLVQVLGPAHRHEQPAAGLSSGVFDRVDALFRPIRHWRAELQQRWLPQDLAHRPVDGALHVHGDATDAAPHPGPGSGHPHHHSAFERHHHALGDPTVVGLEGPNADIAADDAAQAGAGTAHLPLALAPGWALPRAGARAVRWAHPTPERWCDAALRRPERPPSS